MVLMEAKKHSCGEAYKIIKQMFGSVKVGENVWLGDLCYCEKCNIYEFYEQEFGSEKEADSFLENNLEKLIEEQPLKVIYLVPE